MATRAKSKGKGKLKPAPASYPPWPGPEKTDVPEHLWDLRAVYRQEKECDCTPAQRVLRMSLENKPERFMDMLNSAEESYAKNLRKGLGGEGGEVVDMGTEKAMELIERSLGEFKAERAKRKERGE